jgi:SAM-dependent methyltransferase
MGATDDRPAETQGGKPVNLTPGQFVRYLSPETLVADPSDRVGKLCLSVAEGYERWAANYDRDPNPLLALEDRQLKLMIPRMQGKRVLDLACGTGRWLAWLIAEGASLGVGVDFSAAMLAAAKRKSALSGRIVRGDCRAVPFARAAFDLVVCSFAVGHIADLRRVALEVGRVTAPGADVYVSDLHPLAYQQGWHAGFRDRQGSVEIATWPRSAEELLAAWIGGGFDCLQSVECRFTEAERPIFVRAGKASLFDKACRLPAVLLCHFQRAA